MAKSNRYRRFLNVVIAGCLLGVIVGMAPSVIERFRGGQAGSQPATGLTVAPSRGRAIDAAATPEDITRRSQQMNMVRDDLAARHAQVSAQEAALRRDLLGQFWKRQAAVSVMTICLSLAVVLGAIWRTMGRRALQGGLQSEEARLRSLQMAVIGGLEEFETNLRQAQQQTSAPAAAPEPDLMVSPAPTAEAPPLPEPILEEPRRSFFDPNEEQTASEDRVWQAARASLLEELRERRVEGAPEPVAQPEGAWSPEPPPQDSTWARRFLESDAEDTLVEPEGPWQEPAPRESAPRSAPAQMPAGPARPGVREQIEYLAAEGCPQTEIARRLGVSLEEVGLVLQLRSRQGTRGRSWAEPKAS